MAFCIRLFTANETLNCAVNVAELDSYGNTVIYNVTSPGWPDYSPTVDFGWGLPLPPKGQSSLVTIVEFDLAEGDRAFWRIGPTLRQKHAIQG